MPEGFLRRRRSKHLIFCLISAVIGASGCLRPATEAAHLEKGKKLLRQKDYARAMLEFNGAIQAKPKDPEPYYQLGLAYLASGNVAGSVSTLMKATQIDPKYAPAQLKIAELMTTYSTDRGILEEAKKRIEAAIGVLPQDGASQQSGASPQQSYDAQNVLALADLGLGNSEIAAGRLEVILQRLPGDLRTSINLAKVKLALKDFDGAAEVLRKAAAQAPKSAGHALVLGQFYMQMGRHEEAEAQFHRALEIDPAQGLALAMLGQIQSDHHRYDEAEKTFRQLSALDDKEYRPAHAIFLFTHARRDEAIREFEQLWKNGPEDRTTRGRLVSAYGLTGRMGDAERVLNQALRKNPKDTEALEQKAKLSVTLGRVAEAQSALEQVLHYKPDSANGHYLLAQVHKTAGAWALERQELEKAVELDPQNLPARLELARALLGVPSVPLSLKLLDEAPAEQKKQVSWIAQRNWVLFAKSDYSGMRQGVDAGLAMRRTRDLLFQDAMLKLNDGRAAAARAEMDDILKAVPEDTQVLEALATSYAAQRQMPAAIERLRQAAASRPKSAALQLLLGNWLQQSGDQAGARAAFVAARLADPNLASAQLSLAELDLREKKLDSARQTLAPLLSSSNRQVNIQADLLAGGLEHAAGNYQAAMSYFRKAVDQDPSHVVAMEHLAYLLADYGDQLDGALQLAQKAEELRPADPQVEDTLGWILYRKGGYSMALKHLEFASAPSSRWRQKFHLAMVYLKLGEREKGNRILAAALKQNPDLPNALSKYEASAIGNPASQF
jgi:tetratricopeptide (TPR) repeat protein